MKKGFRILKFKKDKPIFEVKDVSKSFDGRPILKKLSLKVYPGECVGFVWAKRMLERLPCFQYAIGNKMLIVVKILINKKSIDQIPIHLKIKRGLGYLTSTKKCI